MVNHQTKTVEDKSSASYSWPPKKKHGYTRKHIGNDCAKASGGPIKLGTCFICGQAGHYLNDPSCPKYDPGKYKGKQRMHMQRVDKEGDSEGEGDRGASDIKHDTWGGSQ